MRVIITRDPDSMGKVGALEIAAYINGFVPTPSKQYFGLGLATGSTPIPIYREWAAMNRQGGVDFSNVATFNLDEYLLLGPDHKQSYNYFMNVNLFNHILQSEQNRKGIRRENIHIPDGLAAEFKGDFHKYCEWYEAEIRRFGGIDVQVLGIGRDGHIAFNEPGSSFGSRTRVKTLDEQTIRDNYSLFFQSQGYGIEEVPTLAITMGIATIMEARHVYLFASGKEKAEVLAQAIEGHVTNRITASKLQDHPSLTVIVDEAAASKLTRRDYYGHVSDGELLLRVIESHIREGRIGEAQEAQKEFTKGVLGLTE